MTNDGSGLKFPSRIRQLKYETAHVSIGSFNAIFKCGYMSLFLETCQIQMYSQQHRRKHSKTYVEVDSNALVVPVAVPGVV